MERNSCHFGEDRQTHLRKSPYTGHISMRSIFSHTGFWRTLRAASSTVEAGDCGRLLVGGCEGILNVDSLVEGITGHPRYMNLYPLSPVPPKFKTNFDCFCSFPVSWQCLRPWFLTRFWPESCRLPFLFRPSFLIRLSTKQLLLKSQRQGMDPSDLLRLTCLCSCLSVFQFGHIGLWKVFYSVPTLSSCIYAGLKRS